VILSQVDINKGNLNKSNMQVVHGIVWVVGRRLARTHQPALSSLTGAYVEPRLHSRA